MRRVPVHRLRVRGVVHRLPAARGDTVVVVVAGRRRRQSGHRCLQHRPPRPGSTGTDSVQLVHARARALALHRAVAASTRADRSPQRQWHSLAAGSRSGSRSRDLGGVGASRTHAYPVRVDLHATRSRSRGPVGAARVRRGQQVGRRLAHTSGRGERRASGAGAGALTWFIREYTSVSLQSSCARLSAQSTAALRRGEPTARPDWSHTRPR